MKTLLPPIYYQRSNSPAIMDDKPFLQEFQLQLTLENTKKIGMKQVRKFNLLYSLLIQCINQNQEGPGERGEMRVSHNQFHTDTSTRTTALQSQKGRTSLSKELQKGEELCFRKDIKTFQNRYSQDKARTCLVIFLVLHTFSLSDIPQQ